MIKYFFLFTFSFVKLSLFAQSGIQYIDSIRLVSKPCTNVVNMAGVHSWHYKNGISRDSSIRQRLSESLSLRPFEVDEGLEITISKKGMKSLLKALHFNRPFKNYIWRLAACEFICPNCGVDPRSSIEGKDVLSAKFEVNEYGEINIISYRYSSPFRPKISLDRRYNHADENLFTKTLTKTLIETATVKSAIMGNKSVKATEDLLIYYPLANRKK
jgi:hypothetical protein